MKKKKEVTHSRAYHRYFEGYAEHKYFDEQEKMHIERVYVGSYYRRDISDKKHLCCRFLYILLYVVGLVAYLYAGTRDSGAGFARYTAIPVVLALIAVIWLAIPLFRNVTAPREMIVRAYRDTSEDLIRASLFAVILQLLNVVASLISLLLVSDQNTAMAVTSIAAYCVSCAAFFGMYFTEKHMPYEKLPPRADIPKDSSIIRYQNNY